MTICYLDAFSGLSGDMLVGALADAGADRQAITSAVGSLNLGAELSFEKVMRRGISALKFSVSGTDSKTHRHLSGILKIIGSAEMPERVKRDATLVFERLGEAEAAVHNMSLEKVHFHEVGAIDSIADIVGACAGFASLQADQIYCSPVNAGSGTVETAHGTLPVPAPATASLLKGKPVYSRGPATELTTPTGAAIASTLSTGFGPMPPLRIDRIGYGAGDKDFKEHANVLRVIVGGSAAVSEATQIVVMEANIDDLSPQVLGYALERLMEAGALDASLQPIAMKKGRPGSLLRVIAKPEDREALAAILFAETSTLGLRTYAAERFIEPRTVVMVETRYGNVNIKISASGNVAPEYEDCRALAAASGHALKNILAEATYEYQKSIR